MYEPYAQTVNIGVCQIATTTNAEPNPNFTITGSTNANIGPGYLIFTHNTRTIPAKVGIRCGIEFEIYNTLRYQQFKVVSKYSTIEPAATHDSTLNIHIDQQYFDDAAIFGASWIVNEPCDANCQVEVWYGNKRLLTETLKIIPGIELPEPANPFPNVTP